MEYLQKPNNLFLFPVCVSFDKHSHNFYIGSDKAVHLKMILRDIFRKHDIPSTATISYEVAYNTNHLSMSLKTHMLNIGLGYFECLDHRANTDFNLLINQRYIPFIRRVDKIETFLANI